MVNEEVLLKLIEDAVDLEIVAFYQIELLNYYLRTNQLDKRHAYYPKYLETLDILINDPYIDYLDDTDE